MKTNYLLFTAFILICGTLMGVATYRDNSHIHIIGEPQYLYIPIDGIKQGDTIVMCKCGKDSKIYHFKQDRREEE